MKATIHWTRNGQEDSLVIYGQTIKEITTKAREEIERRGLGVHKNNCWSEVCYEGRPSREEEE